MARLALWLAVAALASAGNAQDAAPPAALPDIAFCNAQHVASEDDPLPGDPVSIPKAFDRVAKSSPTELALLTQWGKTICDNNVWVSAIADMAWLREDRLLGWEWQGFEAYGYRVFDRAGNGVVIETGARPVFSPGGTRLASVEYSESGFGALNGYGVWEVHPDGLALLGGDASAFEDEGETARFTEPEIFAGTYGEWSISGWKGETCVGIAMRDQDGNRTTFHAAESAGWRIATGPCP
ncbi:hypothetical protein [Erythrobacter oryzae]|uniref:hypothetical protein n=1 Tax=Erythrobacter oryzae TaxID=3019556 RepID=UPI0025578C62|nr:hypothetical protein [Erythrobacter sp. COR-2]